ncbi:hypothetical protein PM082_014514 [Marasmius tenuissimus]|nr:hypothetical protein PM082_014514 [Marasmius tenuissimus]
MATRPMRALPLTYLMVEDVEDAVGGSVDVDRGEEYQRGEAIGAIRVPEPPS